MVAEKVILPIIIAFITIAITGISGLYYRTFDTNDPKVKKYASVLFWACILIAIVALITYYSVVPGSLNSKLPPDKKVELTIAAFPTNYVVRNKPEIYKDATSTKIAKVTQVAQVVTNLNPPLCNDLRSYGNDEKRIATESDGIIFGWQISVGLFTFCIALFIATYIEKFNFLNRYRSASIVIIFISIILIIVFSYFNNYPGILINPQLMDLGRDVDSNSELSSQCATKVAMPPTSTLTATSSATPTATSTITPTPTQTPIPTATVNYALFKPRAEPATEQDFLFYDGFKDDLHKWFPDEKDNAFSIEIANRTLIAKFNPTYNKNYYLWGCDKDCQVQVRSGSLFSIKYTMQAIQGVPNTLSGIAFGSQQSLKDTTGFYILAASNEGRIRFLEFGAENDLANVNSKSYEIPKNGTITFQLDVYNTLCPGNVSPCGMIFVNNKPALNAPVFLEKPIDGYLGIYAFTLQNSAIKTRSISYKSIKIWSTP